MPNMFVVIQKTSADGLAAWLAGWLGGGGVG